MLVLAASGGCGGPLYQAGDSVQKARDSVQKADNDVLSSLTCSVRIPNRHSYARCWFHRLSYARCWFHPSPCHVLPSWSGPSLEHFLYRIPSLVMRPPALIWMNFKTNECLHSGFWSSVAVSDGRPISCSVVDRKRGDDLTLFDCI